MFGGQDGTVFGDSGVNVLSYCYVTVALLPIVHLEGQSHPVKYP